METKKWEKQPLYFVFFANARAGWTLGRNEYVCGCCVGLMVSLSYWTGALF